MSEPQEEGETRWLNHGFCFVLNRIDVECPTPFEVIPGHFLQKANDEEVKQIKAALQAYNFSQNRPLVWLYELDSATQNQLPPNRWLYWVFRFTGTNEDIGDLQTAALLLKDSLYLEMTFTTHHENDKLIAKGFMWSPGAIFQFYQSRVISWLLQTRILRKPDLLEIAENYSLLRNAATNFQSLRKTATRFRNLSDLSDYAEIKVIGYFSIIEALITHPPELTEPMDSLTHQMKTKMRLLGKRFQRSLDYKSAFGTDETDRVWGKLYTYRSKLAHGDEPDFQKDLKLLQSRDNAMAFLKEAAKLTLLHALKEPEFIQDLKAC